MPEELTTTTEPTDLMSVVQATGPGGELATTFEGDEVNSLVKSGDWLPRITICGSTTGIVTEGKINQGVFALIFSNDEFRDLGKQIDFLSITFRGKAMRLKNTPSGKPMSFFDRKSDEFKKVVTESAIKNSGAVWGPEFLIWLPSANTFATYYCNNPTMRRAAPDLLKIMRREGSPDNAPIFDPKPASSVTDFIITPDNKWWGAKFHPHTTPLPPAGIEDFSATLVEQIHKFKNPPKSMVEVAEATTAATQRAR